MADNIEEQVYTIICDQMGVNKDQLSLETSFINDLGADSLDQVELVMEFEERFDLNIPEEDAEKIQTVGDAIKYIKSVIRGNLVIFLLKKVIRWAFNKMYISAAIV